MPVSVIRVAPEPAKESVPAMGSVRCAQTLTVGFEVTGVVAKVNVEEGDRVQRDQVLAELDQSVLDAESAVKEAEIKAGTAEMSFRTEEFRKRDELFKKNAISDSELRKAGFELERAQANLETLKAQQDAIAARKKQRMLRSPVSGVVAKRYIEAGSVVTPTQNRVFRLLRCDDVVAVLELPEKAYRSIRPGQPLIVHVDALGGKRFSSLVHHVCPEIDEKNRTFTIEARVSNPDLIIAAGMFVRAEILPHQDNPSVWIPARALVRVGKKDATVFVVKDGVALKRDVRVAGRDAGRVEVVSGLREGDLLVTEGQDRLSEFSEVSVSRDE
ncbi:MAG: efflux RND transporter periplasmic adaptor subunit [Thermodesulfobacteriota bacterium]